MASGLPKMLRRSHRSSNSTRTVLVGICLGEFPRGQSTLDPLSELEIPDWRKAPHVASRVDLGGTKIQVAIVDKLNRVLGTDRRPTPTVGTPDGVTDTIASSVKAAVVDAGVDLEDLVGVGVGGPGQIDAKAGTLSNAGNLPGWMITYPLAAELSDRLGGSPSNSATTFRLVSTREVRLGAGREYTSLIRVFCGTGVGGGVVIDNELWIGRGAAGEIGHVKVMAKDGALCGCGRYGCMEAYAGRAAMELQARKWHKKGKDQPLQDHEEEG